MLGFAVAFYFVFSHKPYVNAAAAQVPCVTSCLKMLDLRDVYGDVKEHFVDPIPLPIPGLVKRYQRKKKKETSADEETEEEEEQGGEESIIEEQLPLLQDGCIVSEETIEMVMTVEGPPQGEGMGARERHHSAVGGGGGALEGVGGIIIIGESWEDVKRNLSPLETDSKL